MPQDEQNEWPSFETVLRNVATSDRSDVLVSHTEPDAGSEEPSETVVSSDAEVPPTSENRPIDLDLLPAPLAPMDFDTSAVRALLEPRETSTDTAFELEALAPLEPPATIFDEPDMVATEPEISEPEISEPAVSEPEISEPAEFESAVFEPSPFEPDSVFDLAFDADSHVVDHTEPAFDIATDDTTILDEVPGIELPEADDPPAEVFEDLGLASEISLDDVPPFVDDTIDEDEPEHVSLLDAPSIQDIPGGAVFELDSDTIDERQEVESFTTPSIDLFDLQDSSDDVEAERIETYGNDLYSSDLFGASDSGDVASGFDSVATANAIEGELNELSDLAALEPDFEIDDGDRADDSDEESFHLDNVIPLRPDSSDDHVDESASTAPSSEWLNPVDTTKLDGPSPARVSHTGWVGLDSSSAPAEAEHKEADPWAHMRPSEEPKAEGFWGKIFGGDERKRAKARRIAQKKAAAESSDSDDGATTVEHSFDSACPNCGAECEVDLDDPIGRRVHVSCPQCDHMWNTPYIDAPTG